MNQAEDRRSTEDESQEEDALGNIVNQSEAPQGVSLLKFFTYLTLQDKFLLVSGTITAILAGGILPSISLIMGNVASAFSPDASG